MNDISEHFLSMPKDGFQEPGMSQGGHHSGSGCAHRPLSAGELHYISQQTVHTLVHTVRKPHATLFLSVLTPLMGLYTGYFVFAAFV
jgi:hypothetical protein